MKKAVLIGALALAFAFNLASILAEEKALAGGEAAPADAASLVSHAPTRPAESAGPQAAAAVAETQPSAESPFSLEKLVIGLGLCAVIVLAVFRWGTGAQPKKQGKGTAASGSPSA